MPRIKREIVTGKDRENTVNAMQANLYDLIDLSLQGKQAHWNVTGAHFRSVHQELDEIIASIRASTDAIAERIATLGRSPDGRARMVGDRSTIKLFPEGLLSAASVVTAYSDCLAAAIEKLRNSIALVGKHDPVSEDLLIGVSGTLEKHLWMLQSQELEK